MAAMTDGTYQEVLENATGTVNFIELLFNKIIDPTVLALRSSFQKRSVVDELKKGLGEWKSEARDSRGRWRQPYLRSDVFEKHFMKNNGLLEPPIRQNVCTASFGWAHFLYALHIRPGAELVAWRIPPKGEDPAKSGFVSLIIPEVIFYHIINLYQFYQAGTASPDTYDFMFGEIIPKDHNSRCFAFKSGGMATLMGPKLPFGFESGQRKSNLRPAQGDIKAWYERALERWVSDESLELEHAKEDNTNARVKSLLKAMKLIEARDWNNPYLISTAWVEEASRIKRRVTTGGGSDSALIDWVSECIASQPEKVELLVSSLQKSRRDSWEVELSSYIRGLCMFNGEGFQFAWTSGLDSFPSTNNTAFAIALQRQLPWVLEKLAAEPAGSWAKKLSEDAPAEELLQILNLPHKILNAPVIVIQQRPDRSGEDRGRKEFQLLGDYDP